MSECSLGYDPLAGLTGDLGNQVEVRVVVQHGELFDLGRGGDQEIRDAYRTMVPALDQPTLDLTGARFGPVRQGHPKELVNKLLRRFG